MQRATPESTSGGENSRNRQGGDHLAGIDTRQAASQLACPQSGSPTTFQVDLGTLQRNDQESANLDSTRPFEGSPDGERGSKNVSVLQPADEGFGAWSYAASAFAMFVPVWGESTPTSGEISITSS